MSTSKLVLGPDHHLTASNVRWLAYNPRVRVELSSTAKKAVRTSRRVVEKMVKDQKIVYGITTGFGNFKHKFIAQDQVDQLQVNLIRSHAVGVGNLLPKEAVRAALIVRANSLAQGYSGVRLELVEGILDLVNHNIIPAVPSQGSLGASGDLAPLSHMGLVLMGEGKVVTDNGIIDGKSALTKAKLKPIAFSAKEGLAFTNGTSVMTGIASLVVEASFSLLDLADLACAMTLEAVCGVSDAYDPKIHSVRPHPGQQTSAANIKKFVKNSRLVDSVSNRIQDSYTLRCAPQVHGAVRDVLEFVRGVVERELNSATDNPLVFATTDQVISGGNFHGEPIALAMDTLKTALTDLGNISERRTAKLVDSATNEGLPLFLIDPKGAGLNSGLMIAQYTAASVASENKILVHPASADSIPSSANQEDHVSMGTIAARGAYEILNNVQKILAIEFLTACQAIDFRSPEQLGETTAKAYRLIRNHVDFIEEDRELATDIEQIRLLIINGNLNLLIN